MNKLKEFEFNIKIEANEIDNKKINKFLSSISEEMIDSSYVIADNMDLNLRSVSISTDCYDEECNFEDDYCEECNECDCTAKIENDEDESIEILSDFSTEELLEEIARRDKKNKEDEIITFDIDLDDGSYLEDVMLSTSFPDYTLEALKTEDQLVEWLKTDGSKRMHFSGKYLQGHISHPKVISNFEVSR